MGNCKSISSVTGSRKDAPEDVNPTTLEQEQVSAQSIRPVPSNGNAGADHQSRRVNQQVKHGVDAKLDDWLMNTPDPVLRTKSPGPHSTMHSRHSSCEDELEQPPAVDEYTRAARQQQLMPDQAPASSESGGAAAPQEPSAAGKVDASSVPGQPVLPPA